MHMICILLCIELKILIKVSTQKCIYLFILFDVGDRSAKLKVKLQISVVAVTGGLCGKKARKG